MGFGTKGGGWGSGGEGVEAHAERESNGGFEGKNSCIDTPLLLQTYSYSAAVYERKTIWLAIL